MDKRFLIVKKPALHTLQPIQKSLRELSEIRLTETELLTVDSGKKGILIQTILYKILQCIFNNPYETILILFVGILCNN